MADRVIVIDDDEEFSAYLTELLRRAGYVADAMRAAPDLRQRLLDEHARQPIAVIVADVFMPEPDGIEVAKFVAAHLPGVALIGISGMGGPYGRAMVGAHTVLAKPVDAATLLDAVKAALAR